MKCFFWRVLEAAERIVLSYAWNKTPHIRQLHVILYINASPRTVTAPVTMIRSALYGLHESSVAFLFDTNRVMMASFVTAKILNFLSGGRANLLRHNFFGTFYIKTKKLSAWAVIQPAQIMLILLLLLIFFFKYSVISCHFIKCFPFDHLRFVWKDSRRSRETVLRPFCHCFLNKYFKEWRFIFFLSWFWLFSEECFCLHVNLINSVTYESLKH